MKKHLSGYWYQFLMPRRISINQTRIYRWLNFYIKLKDLEKSDK